MSTPQIVFQTWLSVFSAALTTTDPDGVAATFLPSGWFRDVLTFTWDMRALRGPEKISAYLKEHLPSLTLSAIKPDSDPFLTAHYVPDSNDSVIEAAFTYETPIAYGRGYVQLCQAAPELEWAALVVCMTLTDLKGQEEPRDPIDWEAEAQGRPYGELVAERHARNESNPYVLISAYILSTIQSTLYFRSRRDAETLCVCAVGAGQTGLQIAARCNRLNIPTLLIERHEHVGDNWRKRYDSLALHTPKKHHFCEFFRMPIAVIAYTYFI